MELFLMSPPGPDWALRGRANFRSATAPQVDPHLARSEWLALARAIEQRHGRVVCLAPPAGTALTGLPYAAECGQIVKHDGVWTFLVPRMASVHRRGERRLWQPLAERLGLAIVDPLDSLDPLDPLDDPSARTDGLEPTLPGTSSTPESGTSKGSSSAESPGVSSDRASEIWEAQGDVATFRGTTLLFFGGRTTRAGAHAAARYFPGPTMMLEIREPAFHGNMALLSLPAVDRMLVCRDVLAGDGWSRLVEAFGVSALLPVTEDEIRLYATNGLPIGADLLAPHLVPRRVRALVESLGMRVVELAMTELCEKAGGASRCLVSHVSLPDGAIEIPADLALDHFDPAFEGRESPL